MSGPDTLVSQYGQAVTHEYVTDYSLTAAGQVDTSSVVTTTDTIDAVISQPSEEDTQRIEGRLSAGARQLTVASSVDIQATRGGRRDKITIAGDVFEVMEVRDDTHPVTGTRKQTVLIDRLGGRPG